MHRPLAGLVLLLALTTARAADPPANWAGVVDPPAAKVEYPADHTLDVLLPKSFFDPEVVYADQYGPFVFAGRSGGRGEARVLIDLRTGKEVTTLKDELRVEPPTALSRDGTRFAAFANGVRGGELVVLDLTDPAAAVTRVPVPAKPDAAVFVGTDKLLAYTGKNTVRVFDLKTGKPVFESKTEPNHWRAAVPDVTPGGKYVVVPDNKELRFHEVATGKLVGTFPAPKTPANEDQNFESVAVSPDGTRLATVMERFNTRRLLLVDLATGKTLSDKPMTEKAGPPNHRGARLLWAADGSGLLFSGGPMIDPQTAKAVFVPPGPGSARYPLSLGAVVGVENVNGERRLRVASLPADKLATAKAAVQSGGAAADALLPPLTPAATDGAKRIDLPLASQPWAVKPDPAPGTTAAAQPVPVAFGPAGVQSVRVTGGPAPAAVYEVAATAAFEAADNTRPRTLKRVDLLTGRVTDTELPPGCAVQDLAADGSAVVTTDTTTGTRADVFRVGGGKPVGLRPFEKEPEAARKVTFAALAAADRLVTVNGAGTVIGWTLAADRTAAAFVVHAAGFRPVGLTPGRKYLFGLQGTMIRFLDAATGEPAGDLALGFMPHTAGPTNGWAVVVKPDGTEAAAVFNKQASSGAHVLQWDLATGKLADEAPLTAPYPGGPKPVYAGDALLFNGRDLYDPVLKVVVWTYAASGPGWRAADQRPDGRVWYTVGGGANGTATLVAADLPGKAAAKRIAAVVGQPGAVIQPGTKVDLTLDFTGTNAADAKAKAPAELKKAWAARGVEVVANGADVTVLVKVTERDTGERLEFTTTRGPIPASPFARPTDVARLMEVTIETTVLVDGRPAWTAPAVKHSNRPIGRFSLPKEDKTVEGYLMRVMWGNVPGWAAPTLPPFLTKTPDGYRSLPGISQLTAGGPVDAKEALRRTVD